MAAEKKLYFTKIEIDGRCVPMLLTEKEVLRAGDRALEEKNASFLADNIIGICWPVTKPPKCSLWDRFMGKCDCK